jgi:hypothetical protein
VDLRSGMVLYDVVDKSFIILVRRFWSYEGLEAPSYAKINPDFFKVWVWETLSSKEGKMFWSEGGLHNLIKSEIIIVLDDI